MAMDCEIHLSQDGFHSCGLILLHLCCSLWGLENGPSTVIMTSTHDMPDAAMMCFLAYRPGGKLGLLGPAGMNFKPNPRTTATDLQSWHYTT